MKRIIRIGFVITSIAISLLISSCEKKGPVGPQGPQGPQGAPGSAGQNGGPKVTSATFTMSSWSFTAPYYYMNLSVPELTSANVDSALVMVYFSTMGSNWLALPYTQYHSPADYYMGFETSVDTVQVTWVYDSSLSPGSDPNTYYGTTIKCKVVIVPPNGRMAHPNLDMKNYEAVKKAFNLKD